MSARALAGAVLILVLGHMLAPYAALLAIAGLSVFVATCAVLLWVIASSGRRTWTPAPGTGSRRARRAGA